MRAGIDSLPLSTSIFRSYDYTSLQVNLLTNSPLSCFIPHSANTAISFNRSIRVRIPDNLFWSDGKTITPSDYIDGIKLAIKLNPFIRSFLLRHLESISADRDYIEIKLSKINSRIDELLRIPNFCPYRRGSKPTLSSGNWVLSKRYSNKIQFQPNPYQPHQDEALTVHLINSPEDNLGLFSRNEIDVTADTAFPYDKINEYSNSHQIHTHSVGLYAALIFGKALSGSKHRGIRRIISAICAEISFDSITFGQCPKLGHFFSETPSNINFTPQKYPLTLVYDDFYPNMKICILIQKALANYGIQTRLVEDNYYNPNNKFDIRFSILRSLDDSDYSLYATLLFCEPLKNDSQQQKDYLKLLLKMETTPTTDSTNIKNYILDNALLSPLFEIKSLYLSKLNTNPLVNMLIRS